MIPLIGLLVCAWITYKVGEEHGAGAAIVVGMISVLIVGLLLTGDPMGLVSTMPGPSSDNCNYRC